MAEKFSIYLAAFSMTAVLIAAMGLFKFWQ
jgi:hypothetical protein